LPSVASSAAAPDAAASSAAAPSDAIVVARTPGARGVIPADFVNGWRKAKHGGKDMWIKYTDGKRQRCSEGPHMPESRRYSAATARGTRSVKAML
jgi:hypothetical protein